MILRLVSPMYKNAVEKYIIICLAHHELESVIVMIITGSVHGQCKYCSLVYSSFCNANVEDDIVDSAFCKKCLQQCCL